MNKRCEITADNLKKAGWSLGWVSAVDSEGRTIWITDAHRGGQRFVVRADEKLAAFLELEIRNSHGKHEQIIQDSIALARLGSSRLSRATHGTLAFRRSKKCNLSYLAIVDQCAKVKVKVKPERET